MLTEIAKQFGDAVEPILPDFSSYQIDSKNAFVLLLIASIVGFIWYWLSRPINRIMRLEDVGYHPDSGGTTKLEISNRVQRFRRIGEVPPVYPNGWFCVSESRFVTSKTVKAVMALGKNLAVFRGESGEAHVFDAYCPHMGAHLGVGGTVLPGDCLQCPFHGWIFDGKTGQCVKIPYSSGKIPETARVKRWISREINGHIYIWFHCDGIDPTWEIPEIPEVSSGNWAYRGRTEHYVNAHIEEIPENGSDVSHLNIVHRPSLLLGTNLNDMSTECGKITGHHWEASWEADPEIAHIGTLSLYHYIYLAGYQIPGTHFKVKARQIGPGIVYLYYEGGIFGRGAFLHHVTPQEPLMLKMTHQIYAERRIPSIITRILMMSEAYMIERDIMIWNNKCYAPKPMLVKEDALIAKHRRWYSQFFSPNSPRLNDALRSQDTQSW